MIKQIIINKLPWLGKYKRWFVAFMGHVLPKKSTYSQHKEDKFIWEMLQHYNLKNSQYIDIGANHPIDISNTYLLYRNGLSGIIIEPNGELLNLFRRFRKRDIVLQIGCSNSSTVMKFNISKTPVISSFSSSRDVNIYKSLYIPVMTIDMVVENMDLSFISLLTIDVEGLNLEVLQGATLLLKKTLLICIEFDSAEEKEKINAQLGDNFELIKTFDCNLIYLNKYFKVVE